MTRRFTVNRFSPFENPMHSIFMALAPADGGVQFHRVLQPARFCQDRYPDWEFLPGEAVERLPDGYEVYWMHGIPATLGVIEIARQKDRGAKIVWGLDDDLLSVPDWNPAKPPEQARSIYRIMQSLADTVVVSTPSLAQRLRDFSFSGAVFICPNLLDLSRFPQIPFTENDDGSREYDTTQMDKIPVRVTWVGGPTHKGDTDEIVEVLDKFLDEYGTTHACLIWMGAMPHPRLIRKYLHKSLFYQPGVPFASYQAVMRQLEPHVYLAPLAQIPFNESKSALRILEGWAMGACPIATAWGEYKTTIKNGFDGRLVETPGGWLSALDRLVTDPQYRITLALNGRNRVEQEFSWGNEKCREPWYTAFDHITGS